MKTIFSFIALFVSLAAQAQLGPPPATADDVAAGVDNYKYVTPATLRQSGVAGSGGVVSNAVVTLVVDTWYTNGQYPAIVEAQIELPNSAALMLFSVKDTNSAVIGYLPGSAAWDEFGNASKYAFATTTATEDNVQSLGGYVPAYAAFRYYASGTTAYIYDNAPNGTRLVYFGSGTNSGSGTIPDGSITTNKIDSTFYNWVENSGDGVTAAEVAPIAVAAMATNGTVVFNVEKYGAVSGEESTTAIQAAMDAAGAVGGEVYFPNRGYIISTVWSGNTITLRGTGSDYSHTPTLYNTNGAHMIVLTNSGVAGYGTKIIGLNLITTGTTNAIIRAGAGMDVNGLGLITVQDNYFGGGAYGFYGTNVFTSRFSDNKFQSNYVAMGFFGGFPGNLEVTESGGGPEVGTFIYHDCVANLVVERLDCTAKTNHIFVNGRAQSYDIRNSNFEGAELATPSTQNRAYIFAHGSISSTARMRVSGSRFGAKNGGTPFTDTYCMSISNLFLRIGPGMEYGQAGATGQYVEEYGDAPCPINMDEGYPITTFNLITNVSRRVPRNATPHLYDLADGGRSSYSGQGVRGQLWFYSRTNASITASQSDSFNIHALFNGSYQWMNLLGYDYSRQILTRIGVGSNSWSGFSTSASAEGLDVAANALYLGSDANTGGSTRTDNTFKLARIILPSYDRDDTGVLFMNASLGNTANQIDIGGGSSSFDAATVINLRAGGFNTVSPAVILSVTAPAIYANTNLYAHSLTGTNFLAMQTNYVAANFAPVAGLVKFVASNNVVYAVTQASTNALY